MRATTHTDFNGVTIKPGDKVVFQCYFTMAVGIVKCIGLPHDMSGREYIKIEVLKSNKSECVGYVDTVFSYDEQFSEVMVIKE